MIALIANILGQLGQILEGLLDTDGEDGSTLDPVCRVVLAPGSEVAWDSCESGPSGDGQLWAALQSVAKVSSDSGCSIWHWSAEIGIVRCASVPQEDGTPPTVARVEQDALQQAIDAGVVFRLLKCPGFDFSNIELVSWLPLGPSGGCVGGAWTIRGVLNECC